MRGKWLVVALAWWFLLAGKAIYKRDPQFAPLTMLDHLKGEAVVVGPFDDQSTCNSYAQYFYGPAGNITPDFGICWRGEPNSQATPIPAP